MSNAHASFVKLHQGADLYVLPNVWDAGGARLVQQQGALAVGTSSAAMAWSCGHADGGALPDTALLQRVSEIVGVTSLPVTVDIEDGYSDAPDVVAARVLCLADAGVVGINIEDGAGNPAALVAKITAIRSALGGRSLFINARTDVYLRSLAEGDEAVRMSIDRLRAYARAGADGGFVPGLRALDEAAALAGAVPLPLNLMWLPGMASFAALSQVGVRRLSAGPALFMHAWTAMAAATTDFLGDAMAMPEGAPGYAALNQLFSER
ncbi:Oxaloacetate decarboxylase [compost metagenome]|uniref:isocitrate lyase/PEP mutase family protein n=1 Tax=Stenotrophomonas TaxID=40323 RepID=UPI000FBA23AA|nr:isocitrate lyase/phosphoenolpyruvate mutase family protein [Stenotrophomonas sp. PA-6-5C]